MSQWLDRILDGFDPSLARFCIVSDPDGLLLDEHALANLDEKGFEVLPFEDPILFRAEYEERYRERWDRGEPGDHAGLILHTRSPDVGALPWDYLHHGKRYELSLAQLLPRLSYSVVRQLDGVDLDAVFEAHEQHADQGLGENATKDFVLTHLHRISPPLIQTVPDLLAALMRMHYPGHTMPPILAGRMQDVLGAKDAFKRWPIRQLFESRSFFLQFIQERWNWYVEHRLANAQPGIAEEGRGRAGLAEPIVLPFEHHDVRAFLDSLFLEGSLDPVGLESLPDNLPEWMKTGVTVSEVMAADRVLAGFTALAGGIPNATSSYRDWIGFGQKLTELYARWGRLSAPHAGKVQDVLLQLQTSLDEAFRAWLSTHFSTLSSLPVTRAPVMVHHVPRFLAMQLDDSNARIALVVMDGLALDQWAFIRQWLNARQPALRFEETAAFAWLPTMTAISRQAIFAGAIPRAFASTIATTSEEPAHWTRFWQDHGLRPQQVHYHKGLRLPAHLPELQAELANAHLRAVGLVVDAVDEIAHGAAIGRRSMYSQLVEWCETGFLEELLSMLHERGFRVFITSDHGNVEATGTGRPAQGVIAEARGERVRVYGSENLRDQSAQACAGAFALPLPGLPNDFFPLFAPGRSAFVAGGETIVAHGGCSIEEVLVPFVEVIEPQH